MGRYHGNESFSPTTDVVFDNHGVDGVQSVNAKTLNTTWSVASEEYKSKKDVSNSSPNKENSPTPFSQKWEEFEMIEEHPGTEGGVFSELREEKEDTYCDTFTYVWIS